MTETPEYNENCMSAERIPTSPTFWPRQGLLDSLSQVLGGGESKKEADPTVDPFFVFEAWLAPEFSEMGTGPPPDEEELKQRLAIAPGRILEFVAEGLLTKEDCRQIFRENGLEIPYEIQDAAASEAGRGGLGGWPIHYRETGQLAMINFRLPETYVEGT